jgi:hypothetical protein
MSLLFYARPHLHQLTVPKIMSRESQYGQYSYKKRSKHLWFLAIKRCQCEVYDFAYVTPTRKVHRCGILLSENAVL